MNIANQLIQKAKKRLGYSSICETIDNLNVKQLECRRQKIKSTYFVLGMALLLALITNSFTMFDTLEYLIPFMVAMVCLFLVYYKEYRKKIDQINELLSQYQ